MDKKTKIIFAMQDFGVGGSESAVINQANILHERGFEVRILTVSKYPKDDLIGNLKIPPSGIVRFYASSIFDVAQIIKIANFLRGYKPDIVVSNLFFTNSLLKFVKLLYGDFDLFIREGNVIARRSKKSVLFDRFTSFMVKGFIANAEAVKRGMVEQLKIPEQKIRVIYNGINPDSFSAPRVSGEQKRTELGVAADSFLVLHVGSMISEQKGQQYLIEALAKIPTGENVTFLFAGEGGKKKFLLEYAKKLGVAHRVIFLGKRRDIKDLMYASDVFVFPSLWEGMPNALLESMAAGLPVIASYAGGIPEVIRDGESGILVESKDIEGIGRAILRLKKDPDFRKRLARYARQVVSEKRFAWDYHVDKLYDLLLIP